jgi:predicted outer membrane repeat protein
MQTRTLARGMVMLLAGTLAWATVAQAQTTWYVDDDASPGGTGSSWASPFNDLQDALDAAGTNDAVHIAGGTYTPSALFDPNDPSPTDPRMATFLLPGNLALYGGYAGMANPGNPDQRDIGTYETILSGDLAGNDGPDFANNEENSYHVVYAYGAAVTARLDGLTITAGNANHADAPHRDGGGITIFEGAAPTLEDCTILANFAYMGGGLYTNASSPTVISCVFDGNLADWGGGANNTTCDTLYTDCSFTGNSTNNDGGGMRNVGDANPTLINCNFSNNHAVLNGGGMANVDTCDPMLVGCTFVGNSADASAGGVYSTVTSSPTLVNCVFDGNAAGTHGGAMHSRETSSPSITNCLFINNTAANNGGALVTRLGSNPTITNCTFNGNAAGLSGGSIFVKNTNPVINNCILWGDTPEAVYVDGGAPVVTYSDVEGGWTGAGNINADPAFTADHHLSGGSPCIDAADNLVVPADAADLDDDGDTAERTPLDLDFSARFVDDAGTTDTGVPDPPDYPEVVDMGAYEFGGGGCFGDLDGDNDIDLADLAQLLGNYGETSGMTYEDGDLDGDGDVDLADLADLLGVYGTSC